ncbi:putative immunity protein [Streptomyces sp. NPDC048057]|uniref:putative immunity protein n=1 Tax=Streptomyces sp. NPDC048057 TaxID=3155628 RepID=UPI0033D30AC9
MAQSAHTVSGDFDLTMAELRVVARYVVWHAEDVLAVFERDVPDDPRPREAIDAAWCFINGANRTRLQRTTSVEAHRAARSAPSEAARLAARAAGDAASAAYLHPIWQASQVGHILRASSSAARIAELEAGGDPRKGDAQLERSRQRATPVLVDVLRRYPPAAGGRDRVARLMSDLDRSLRQSAEVAAGASPPRC